jgi:hypothetical protein
MDLTDAVFFHIHSYGGDTPMLLPNYEYPIGDGPNFFWQYYLMHEIRYQKDPYKNKFAGKLGKLHLESGQFENIELTKDVFAFLQFAASEMGMFLREMILEELRRETYSFAPSRRTCMWLIDEKCIGFWQNWFGKAKHKLYKVSCSGNAHKGSSKYLDSDSMTYDEYRRNAEAYWTSLDCDDDDHEYIFVGKVKIIEEVGI